MDVTAAIKTSLTAQPGFQDKDCNSANHFISKGSVKMLRTQLVANIWGKTQQILQLFNVTSAVTIVNCPCCLQNIGQHQPAHLHQPCLQHMTSGSNLERQSEGVSFTPWSQSASPVKVNPCQSAVSLSAAKSSETRLVSYFTYTHHRVIDFSFSESETHSLSFIPERRQLPEAWWRHQLNVICLRALRLFGSPWNEALLFFLHAYQRLFNSRGVCIKMQMSSIQ